MNGLIRLCLVGMLIGTLTTSCVSGPTPSDDLTDTSDGLESDQLADSMDSADSSAPADSNASTDFDDLDTPSKKSANNGSSNPPADAAANSSADSDLSIEDEVNQANGGKDQSADVVPAAPNEDVVAQSEPAPVTPDAAPAPDIVPPVTTQEPVTPEPVAQEALPVPVADPEPAVAAHSALVEITGLKFQANDAGGTILIEATGPVVYTTRENPDLRQFIIEVENAKLPAKLKRSLNTKDIKGAIGTVDAYQNPGATTARFVVQLREGAGTPAVQQEGNNLLIVAAPGTVDSAPVVHATSEVPSEISEGDSDKILSSQKLSDFLADNTKFYGKKISLETNDMDVREALKFITEESGVNMVIADEVKGNLSLKLRQVPWDQALVVVMKARKLGYTRQGNVLRIAPIADLKQEEDDAAKLAAARKGFEPLKVRMFPISYAKVDELEKKIKDFLTERGKVIGDARTNALVVTDQEDSLARVAKLIASLDVQPAQVLIEGKIVEAQETFLRSVGVSWNGSGDVIKLGTGKRGPINMSPSFNSNAGTNTGNFNFGLSLGTLDFLGNLSASLALSEKEEKVKVISSPRILTLSNVKSGISQTTEVPLKTITVQNGVSQETYQFKPLTMKLDVTPQITADASVIMDVEVNRQFQGAIVSATTQAFPVNSREAKTKVLVKNGQTAIIGGIYQSDATEGNEGTPWVKDIPVIGSLFKKSNARKEKIELVIFLTPRIIGQQQVETTSATPATTDF